MLQFAPFVLFLKYGIIKVLTLHAVDKTSMLRGQIHQPRWKTATRLSICGLSAGAAAAGQVLGPGHANVAFDTGSDHDRR